MLHIRTILINLTESTYRGSKGRNVLEKDTYEDLNKMQSFLQGSKRISVNQKN